MAVGTKEREIGQAIIFPISVYVLNFDGNLASLEVAPRPRAAQTSLAVVVPQKAREKVLSNVTADAPLHKERFRFARVPILVHAAE